MEAKTETFQALDFQGSVVDIPVVEFAEKGEKENFRGVHLYGDQENGRAVRVKIEGWAITPRWLVFGDGTGQYVTYNSTYDKNYVGNEKGQGYQLSNSANGKQHLHMWWYYSGDWSGGNAVFKKNQFSCMYVGGDKYLPAGFDKKYENHFQKFHDANQKLVATGFGPTDFTDKDIPLTSKILRIRRHQDPTNGDGGVEGVNTGAITSDFKPRGCIFAFKVQNETGKKIQLVSISGMNTTTYPSPLWYTGYFSVKDFFDAPLDGSVFSGDEYTIPFVGETMSGDFPFYSDANTAGFDLEVGATSTKRFFIWGYPIPKVAPSAISPVVRDKDGKEVKDPNLNSTKPLVVKVNYRFYGDDGVLQTREVFSIGQKFNAPSSAGKGNTEGWQDGWCYRATLHIKKRTGDNPLPIVEYMELKSNIIDSYDDKYSTIENEITDAN